MKKIYQGNALVSVHIDNADQFAKDLGNVIEEYQQRGLQVEVQFQSNHVRFSALVLGYTEENQ